jgi:D-alanine-D-alanine ligase
MKVGLTYDLKDDYKDSGLDAETIAEFDAIDTVEGIESALHKMGFQTDRIGHIKNLVHRLAQGDRWDFVFNITEGLYGIAREAQVPALLEAYQIPCTFSDAAGMSLMLDKGTTKLVLREHNIPTAPFKVVKTLDDLQDINLPYPLFAKPLAEGTGKGISGKSKIETAAQLKESCTDLLRRFNQPVLVETYLSGREFTVGMLGMDETTRVIGIMEVAIDETRGIGNYGYGNKTDFFDHISYSLLDEKKEPALFKAVNDIAIASWRALNCRDGGRLDIRCDDQGVPHIMEINPLAGLRPGFSDLVVLCDLAGMDHPALIREIVTGTCARCGLILPEAQHEAA